MNRRALLLRQDKYPEVVEPDGLDDMYRLLECETIDVVRVRPYGKGWIDLIVDDEARITRRFPPNPWTLLLLDGSSYFILGHALLVLTDEEGERVPLPDGIIQGIMSKVKAMCEPRMELVAWE